MEAIIIGLFCYMFLIIFNTIKEKNFKKIHWTIYLFLGIFFNFLSIWISSIILSSFFTMLGFCFFFLLDFYK